ncbi:tetratricopeptide repeat protein [Micromonospora sp. NBC_00898]|uniref:AfsR/SARP family transcriptional regulator n=1 Tax=Micromonospora sp. NBC_00898 TaxID=2975981 RepID=UPI00386DFDA3|nr:tetratricopeptide repeat protein [Micromonospora sp. NBC_00898]
MDFRLLGAVEMYADDGEPIRLRRRQERLALAVLLLEPGRVVSVDRLIGLLWGQAPPANARAALQTLMSRVRTAVRLAAGPDPEGPALLVAHGAGYRLRVPPESVDLHRFQELVGEARGIADPHRRSAQLAAALDLWRGPALAGAATGPTRQRLCGALEEARLTALLDRIDADLAAGRHAELVSELTEIVNDHALQERLHGQLMLALYRSGRRAEALAAYRRARRLLVAELGLEPGPSLRGLEAAIIVDSPTLGAVSDVEHLDPDRAADPPGTNGVAPPGPSEQAGAAPTVPAPPLTVVPAQLPAGVAAFVGRTGYLSRLDALLPAEGGDGPRSPAIVAITGTAGVGKTALALHWAHRARHAFPDGQLYVNLRGFDADGTSAGPAEVLQVFLDALHVPAQRIPANLPAQTNLCRSLLADRRMLIVLDNARDAEQVRPLLPGAPGCLVVVTSRNRLASLVVTEGAHPVHVELLTDAQARQLLLSRLGNHRVAAEPDAVAEIVSLCTGLPLALAIVAARAAANPAFPLSAIAGELRATRGRLDAFDGGDEFTGVRSVLSWSYRTLSPDAARLFRLLGLHPGSDLAAPAAASLAGVPVAQVRPLLATLTGAHLLFESSPGRYSFHDLLRAYATELVQAQESESDRSHALHRLFDHYLHTADLANRLLYPDRHLMTLSAPRPGVTVSDLKDLRQAVAWFSTEHRVLLAAINHAVEHGFDTHTWQLARILTTFFHRGGLWHGLVATQHTVSKAAGRITDPAGRAHLHRSLAVAIVALGRDDEAQTHLEYALDRFRELGDASYLADTHMGLVWVHGRLGHPDKGLHHAEQALALWRTTGQRAGQANALNNIGWWHAQLGRYDQALACCQEALTLHDEIGDDTHGGAVALDSLGFIHHRLGDHEQATALYQRALTLYREVNSRYYETRTLTRLGDLHRTVGDLDAARRDWRQALAILDELTHPDAEQLRDRLASLRD